MLNLFIDAFRIIRRNKGFIFVLLVSLFLSRLSLIPEQAGWPSLLLRFVNLLLALFMHLYAIAIVLVEKGLLETNEAPVKLTYKFIGQGVFVALVSAFWILLILALPYLVVNYFEDSVSGIFASVLDAVKSFVLGILIFSAFTVGVAVLMSRKTPVLESPALGLSEVYNNFPYYIKYFFIIAIIEQLPDILLFISLYVLNLDAISAIEQFSYFPNNIANISTPNLFIMLMYGLVYWIINLFQRIALVLVYTNRPKNTEEKRLVQGLA